MQSQADLPVTVALKVLVVDEAAEVSLLGKTDKPEGML